MAATQTEPTSPKKPAAKTAAKPQSAPEAKSAPTSVESPGQIIAERYRDTAYEALVGRNGENVSAVMSAGEAMLSGMAEVSQEMMTFAGERLRQDIESAEDFARSKSPEELFQKQCSFAQRAAEQYAEETSRLIALFARIQQNCWKPMEERTKAALHDMNGGDADEKAEK